MTDESIAAHKNFSAEFFNRTWELLDKPDRTAEDDERMISLSHASLAHWRERPDCIARNLSIGYWQLSRVYAVTRQPENAKRYGELCLAASQHEPPFYLGFAHEALARAATLAGDRESFAQQLAAAWSCAEQVVDPDEKKLLVADLQQLGPV